MQVGKFISPTIIDRAVSETKSDAYYKTLTTHKQLICMLYGVISKFDSFNLLCKNLQFLDNKLTSIGIDELPARSTLADANSNRHSRVFELIYNNLYHHYKDTIGNENYHLIKDIDGVKTVEIIDSSTITLFDNICRGVGRNCIKGDKKGGLKLHTKLPLGGMAPNLVHITESATNDKDFLGQLNIQSNTIYVFDKGYVNHKRWQEMTDKSAFWITRMNKNAIYEVLKEKTYDIIDYADGGIISEAIIQTKNKQSPLKARKVVYKDGKSGKVLTFITNLLDYDPLIIAQLYKYRWSIEVFFKRLKGNFQLHYFYSDSIEGIKSQIWIVLIANLIMSLIHSITKEKESFTTVVAMAASNMASYISLIAIICQERPTKKPKIRIMQLNLFYPK